MLLKDNVKVGIPQKFIDDFKKPVTFELHPSQTPISHITKKRSFPRSRGIESFYQMTEVDKGVEKVVTFRYAATQRQSKQGSMTEYSYEPTEIEFMDKGNIVLDPKVPNHRELYYWMSMHPQNASNPNYNQKKGAIFLQLNPEKDAQERMAQKQKKHDAEELILRTWSFDELQEMASSFGDQTAHARPKEEISMVRDFLMNIMERNPVEFYEKAQSDHVKKRAEITEAMSYGILTLNDRDWLWSKEDAVKKGKPICSCNPNEDEKDRLIRFFAAANRVENMDYFYDKLKGARKEKDKQLEHA